MSQKPVAIAVQTFNVPPRRVYDAILDPAMIARFMFGPLLREEEILHIRNDPRTGGAFSFKVRRGEHIVDHVGTYLELNPPGCIAFTWGIAGQSDPAGSIVRIDITPTAEGSTLRLAHEMAPEWADYVDRTSAGWTKIFGVLAALL